MKKFILCILSISLIAALCLSLSGCEDPEHNIIDNFMYGTDGGKYNAIKIELGDGKEAIYFIDENYGIWNDDKETFMFYISLTEPRGKRYVEIFKYSPLAYFKARVECPSLTVVRSEEDEIFYGYPTVSDNGLVATFLPDNTYVNKLSSQSEATVTMTKIKLPSNEITPHDIAIDNMKFIPDAYFDFVSGKSSSQYLCEIANLWIDGSTMTGEWNTNGSIIPIRMNIHGEVPYIEIYDISGSSEKLILKSYANVIDNSSIELIDPEGEIFYTTPPTPVIITKTS